MKSADVYLVLGLVAALLLMGFLVLGTEVGGGPAAESGLPGEARDVDMDLLRRRIIREELSDREALYWHR